MATPLKIKRSAVSNKRPTISDLQLGELALNTYDGYLFAERDTGGVGIGTTVALLTPWIENFGSQSIYYNNLVGIGTTNPRTKLEVNGVLGFSDGNVRIGDSTTGLNGTSFNNNFIGVGAGKNDLNYQGIVGIIDSPLNVTSSTTIPSQVNGDYYPVSGTGGSGTEAQFEVYRDETGAISSIVPTNGQNYQVGDVITIDGADVGGVSGTDDITLIITSVYTTTGDNNNFLGYKTGYNNASGSYNNFFGHFAGKYNTTGYYNNFLGQNAGYNNTTGSNNNFLGHNAGQNNDTGYYNNFLGYNTGYSNIYGSNNNFLGLSAGYCNTYGDNNNFLGLSAGYNNIDGYYNNFFGNYAGYNNIDGYSNNFLGSLAGRQNTTGNSNNFFGVQSGYGNTTGNNNNFLGAYAGRQNTTGNSNNFFGLYAGRQNTTGSNNTFLGAYSGISTSASYKVVIGSGYNYQNSFDSPDTTKDNQFAVGIRNYNNPSKYWLVGDENFNIGIGTTNPRTKLEVQNGDMRVGVDTSTGLILTSPNGIQFRLTVDDGGILTAVGV